ncbi:MAG TPA: hypothetical protein VMR59_00310 [Patescibacteria group bacterium]|nr:hypothetical protein [Patescibacteria group bacterium]
MSQIERIEASLGTFGGSGSERVPDDLTVVFDSGDGFRVGVHRQGFGDKLLASRRVAVWVNDSQEKCEFSLVEGKEIIIRRSSGGIAQLRIALGMGIYRGPDDELARFFPLENPR